MSTSSSSSWIKVQHNPEAEGLVQYLNASPTPYHAVANAAAQLEKKGFTKLNERDSWNAKIKPNSKYFVTRGQTSLIAFAVGGKYKSGNGISIVGTHTDSCCFKIRPVSKKEDFGYIRVGVEKYGGGLWHTWLDRDLGLAGRVITSSFDGSYSTHLVKIDKPLLRIPTIAIHLMREQNDKMSYNPETEMVPILGLVSSQLNSPTESESGLHSPLLLQVLADHLQLSSISEIEDFDLRLFDLQPSCLGGASEEFVYSGRLDNLFSTFCATAALSLTETASLESDTTSRMIALYDHEEVGSGSAVGAESNFLESVIGRFVTTVKKSASNEEEALHQTIANSFLLSSDMGHAIHPSFPAKHEVNLRPVMNGGPAIKTNANQRYATSSETYFLLKRIAKQAQVPLQQYGVRNDMGCGSTIGPLISKIGLRTVDLGCAQLSMHSIRETAGSQDVAHLINLFKAFHEHFAKVDAELHFA